MNPTPDGAAASSSINPFRSGVEDSDAPSRAPIGLTSPAAWPNLCVQRNAVARHATIPRAARTSITRRAARTWRMRSTMGRMALVSRVRRPGGVAAAPDQWSRAAITVRCDTCGTRCTGKFSRVPRGVGAWPGQPPVVFGPSLGVGRTVAAPARAIRRARAGGRRCDDPPAPVADPTIGNVLDLLNELVRGMETAGRPAGRTGRPAGQAPQDDRRARGRPRRRGNGRFWRLSRIPTLAVRSRRTHKTSCLSTHRAGDSPRSADVGADDQR